MPDILAADRRDQCPTRVGGVAKERGTKWGRHTMCPIQPRSPPLHTLNGVAVESSVWTSYTAAELALSKSSNSSLMCGQERVRLHSSNCCELQGQIAKADPIDTGRRHLETTRCSGRRLSRLGGPLSHPGSPGRVETVQDGARTREARGQPPCASESLMSLKSRGLQLWSGDGPGPSPDPCPSSWMEFDVHQC
ncbi:hypothetical protein BD413DRAFT_533468 [Trametes elegans]|nr:hypothetical protein BD413DRAFT_533468 [Trametes elegans]